MTGRAASPSSTSGVSGRSLGDLEGVNAHGVEDHAIHQAFFAVLDDRALRLHAVRGLLDDHAQALARGLLADVAGDFSQVRLVDERGWRARSSPALPAASRRAVRFGR